MAVKSHRLVGTVALDKEIIRPFMQETRVRFPLKSPTASLASVEFGLQGPIRRPARHLSGASADLPINQSPIQRRRLIVLPSDKQTPHHPDQWREILPSRANDPVCAAIRGSRRALAGYPWRGLDSPD